MDRIQQVLNIPQQKIYNSGAALNLALFGKGTGKSHCAGYISYRNIFHFPEVWGFIGANTYDQLNAATLLKVKSVWSSFGITEYNKDNPDGVYVSQVQPPDGWNTDKHHFDRYNNIISFKTGTIIFTGSLDNVKGHDGKEFSWAILDETKDTREDDVKDVILTRLRQKGIFCDKNGMISKNPNDSPVCPCYFLTSPAKTEWLNEMFELDDYIDEIEAKIYNPKEYFEKRIRSKYVVIASALHNLDNLPSSFIEQQRENLSEERFKALIYANPFATSGGEFYSSFSRMKHVCRIEYNNQIPIHISFDQNTVPYNSCLLSLIVKENETWYCRLIGEIALENPHNSTEEVCEAILRQYGDAPYYFIYGDASGNNRSTISKTEKHHYQVIERMLKKKLTNSSNRVSRKNPPLIARREFANKIFEEKLPIRVQISEKCSKLLADFTYIKQDVDGSKKKEIETNKETGERYQKYGHLSDCYDYLITQAFNIYF